MPKSPTGIIPAEFTTGGDVRKVIEYLKAMPLPGEDKAELLFGWARNVGIKITTAQLSEVRQTGTDR